MHKKILALCAALVALGALAIPSFASAAITLQENGTKILSTEDTSTPPKIIATQDSTTPISIFSGSGLTIECNENKITGHLIKNNGTTVEGTITTADFQSNLTTEGTKCKSNLGNLTITTNASNAGEDWCLKNIAGEDRFEIKGCAATPLTFTLAGPTTCKYKRLAAVTGNFTTTTGAAAATLEVTGEPEMEREEGGILCPAIGKIKQMKFELFTDAEPESPLQLNDVS